MNTKLKQYDKENDILDLKFNSVISSNNNLLDSLRELSNEILEHENDFHDLVNDKLLKNIRTNYKSLIQKLLTNESLVEKLVELCVSSDTNKISEDEIRAIIEKVIDKVSSIKQTKEETVDIEPIKTIDNDIDSFQKTISGINLKIISIISKSNNLLKSIDKTIFNNKKLTLNTSISHKSSISIISKIKTKTNILKKNITGASIAKNIGKFFTGIKNILSKGFTMIKNAMLAIGKTVLKIGKFIINLIVKTVTFIAGLVVSIVTMILGGIFKVIVSGISIVIKTLLFATKMIFSAIAILVKITTVVVSTVAKLGKKIVSSVFSISNKIFKKIFTPSKKIVSGIFKIILLTKAFWFFVGFFYGKIKHVFIDGILGVAKTIKDDINAGIKGIRTVLFGENNDSNLANFTDNIKKRFDSLIDKGLTFAEPVLTTSEKYAEKIIQNVNFILTDPLAAITELFIKNKTRFVGALVGSTIGGLIGGPIGALIGGFLGSLVGDIVGYFWKQDIESITMNKANNRSMLAKYTTETIQNPSSTVETLSDYRTKRRGSQLSISGGGLTSVSNKRPADEYNFGEDEQMSNEYFKSLDPNTSNLLKLAANVAPTHLGQFFDIPEVETPAIEQMVGGTGITGFLKHLADEKTKVTITGSDGTVSTRETSVANWSDNDYRGLLLEVILPDPANNPRHPSHDEFTKNALTSIIKAIYSEDAQNSYKKYISLENFMGNSDTVNAIAKAVAYGFYYELVNAGLHNHTALALQSLKKKFGDDSDTGFLFLKRLLNLDLEQLTPDIFSPEGFYWARSSVKDRFNNKESRWRQTILPVEHEQDILFKTRVEALRSLANDIDNPKTYYEWATFLFNLGSVPPYVNKDLAQRIKDNLNLIESIISNNSYIYKLYPSLSEFIKAITLRIFKPNTNLSKYLPNVDKSIANIIYQRYSKYLSDLSDNNFLKFVKSLTEKDIGRIYSDFIRMNNNIDFSVITSLFRPAFSGIDEELSFLMTNLQDEDRDYSIRLNGYIKDIGIGNLTNENAIDLLSQELERIFNDSTIDSTEAGYLQKLVDLFSEEDVAKIMDAILRKNKNSDQLMTSSNVAIIQRILGDSAQGIIDISTDHESEESSSPGVHSDHSEN